MKLNLVPSAEAGWVGVCGSDEVELEYAGIIAPQATQQST